MRASKSALFAAGLIFLLFAPAAIASGPPPEDAASATIVVTGRKMPDRDAAQRFVTAISKSTDGQLARFRQPVCPAVIGIEVTHAHVIAERIRAVAREAGIAVAAEGCTANLTLILSRDPKAMVRGMEQKNAGWFAGVGRAELATLRESDLPARSWANTLLANEDGQFGLTKTDDGYSDGRAGTGLSAAPVMIVRSASIINPPTRQVIGAAFLIVDARVAVGKTLIQVADYAAMRTLARTRGADPAADTILSLLDGGEAPAEMTAIDRAYLKALYRGAGNRRLASQLRSIAESLAPDPKPGAMAKP